MTPISDTLPYAVEDRPAGAAPVDEVLIASGSAAFLSLALLALVLLHRGGRLPALDRAMRRLEHTRFAGGVAAWAMVPMMVAMVSLITALLGMYWDIALHIGVGRDEGPLANPAHYPIMFGLFGISTAGVLACALPRGGEAGPAAVRLSRDWHAPVGGVLLTAAGSFALLGFPLDDVWHRIFGQDVTLWGPTHLMLIGGAGLSLVAMAVLMQEGRVAGGGPSSPEGSRGRSFLMRCQLMGGLLIGLSVFQAEFDFGVPQFRLVLQPFLIAGAAGLALVAARLWIGRGGALGAAVFYLLVRGGVSVVVGGVLGELWAAVPLYLAEALLVEAAALVVRRRPLLLGVVSGVLIGTAGYAAEHAWTQWAFRLPWTSDIVVEGVAMATVAGVAGGVLGALLHLGLTSSLPAGGRPRLLFAGAVLAIAAGTANGLVATADAVPGEDLGATLQVTPVPGSVDADGEAEVEVTLRTDQRALDGEPAWLTMTAWQGGRESEGLHVQHLERVADDTWRTTEPVPVGATWKTLVRLHDGRVLTALPVYLPEDTALGEPELPAADDQRVFTEEKLILQRELEDDVPGWLWLVAGLVVLACAVALVLGLGWGVSRFSRARADAEGAPAEADAPASYVG